MLREPRLRLENSRHRLCASACIYVAALGLAFPAPGLGQARGAPPVATKRATMIRRKVSEVLADFVVVNRGGQVVLGLKPQEINVFDNGIRQRIESLRFVAHSVRLRARNWQAIGARAPKAQPPAANLTAIVFDPIDNAGEPLARRAAVQLVADDLAANNYLAVFRRNHQLTLLQPFTNNPAALDRAISEAATRATVQIHYQRQVDEYRAMLAAFSGVGRGGPPISATTRAAGLPNWLGASMPVVANISMLGAMQSAAEVSAKAAGIWRTRSEMADLRRLVKMLAPYQGRKSVVIFTERLYVRNGLRFIFRALIQDANRATVSFYPVDVAGLSIRPDLSALAAALRGPTYGVERGAPAEPDVRDAVSGSQTVLLSELAASTGGAAVTDTNDPAHFMNRIAEQSTEHYELAFTPRRGVAPGRAPVRHVVVIRIPRHQHWRVYGRKVYYARFATARRP